MTDHPQFGLPLPASVTYAPEDFFVSGSNREAYDTLLGKWEQPVLVLYGAEASGKTHLAHIWARQAGAGTLLPQEVTQERIAAQLSAQTFAGTFVLDGLEQVEDETALFHLLNAIREQGGQLLLVSAVAPSHLPVKLADARSRLNAAPAVALHAPDDEALRAVLIKQLSDRQLRVGEDVLHYLLLRMDRSFASARHWVERIDRSSLASQRRVTVAWLRGLMDNENE